MPRPRGSHKYRGRRRDRFGVYHKSVAQVDAMVNWRGIAVRCDIGLWRILFLCVKGLRFSIE